MKPNALILSLGVLVYMGVVIWNTQISPVAFPTMLLDEQGHYSYTMDLILHRHWWPDFNHFYMTGPVTRQPTGALDYINHPPLFYWLMRPLQQLFPNAAPIRYRLFSAVFYFAAAGLYAWAGYRLKLSWPLALGYILMPALFAVPLYSGFYNNDSIAILGGMMACIGTLDWFTSQRLQRAAVWMLLGLTLASVKLTAFLLVGSYVFAVLVGYRKNLAALPHWMALAGIAWAGVLCLPYVHLMQLYGSPAPNTIGQQWLLHQYPPSPWLNIELQASFPRFVMLSMQWFASMSPGRWNYVPLIWLLVSYALCLLLPRQRRQLPQPFVGLTLASLVATTIMFSSHLIFSYHRYIQYNWIYDMFPRYYFPLLPAYGAAMIVGWHLLLGLFRRKR